ncbi:MAG: hypothetical protein BWY09_01243 [Candidatus Hydrogenedentes bacterium ADurb.Bin179]|nr:MAG: hypothetical protein BWY09_01243 [Candidatus Hydrogenedentes bacterium ADurb.Bin179]
MTGAHCVPGEETMFFPVSVRSGLLLAAGLVLFSISAAAETTSETHPGLKQLLQRYPEADLNKDGALSLEEAKGFRTHLWQEETEAGTPVDRTQPEAAAKAPMRPGDPLLDDVAYGDLPGQRFDLWLPRNAAPPCPAVFCLALEPDAVVPPADLLKKCLETGIAVGVLHGRDGGDAPAYFTDVELGLRFLRENGHAHGVRADRMALFGQGAAAEQVLYGALLPLGEEGQSGGIRCAALLNAPACGGTEQTPDPDACLAETYPKVDSLLAASHGAPVIALLHSGQNTGDSLMQALRRKSLEVFLNNAAENEGIPHLVRQAVLFFKEQLDPSAGTETPATPDKKEQP